MLTPEQIAAYKIVSKHRTDGTLPIPLRCGICRTPGVKLHGHHEDYSQPMKLLFVCVSCHVALHQNRRAVMPDNAEFRQWIEDIARPAKMTLMEMGEVLGITRQAVSQRLRRLNIPTPSGLTAGGCPEGRPPRCQIVKRDSANY